MGKRGRTIIFEEHLIRIAQYVCLAILAEGHRLPIAPFGVAFRKLARAATTNRVVNAFALHMRRGATVHT